VYAWGGETVLSMPGPVIAGRMWNMNEYKIATHPIVFQTWLWGVNHIPPAHSLAMYITSYQTWWWSQVLLNSRLFDHDGIYSLRRFINLYLSLSFKFNISKCSSNYITVPQR
jgi:hypothetical protein